MTSPRHRRRPLLGGPLRLAAVVLALAALVSGCAGPGGASSAGEGRVFNIGAIPDQDPEKLQRLYGRLATYLSSRLGVRVRYRPVTEYVAAVTLFRTGDLDMVWFGGLTGVQARAQVPGARAILQRDIDAAFRSVFIAGTASGVAPVRDVAGLAVLEGRRFTFGSESSTSGRLMPEHFLAQAGVHPDDFAGRPGFSGSHDRTIALVEAGTFEAGVLNEQVWQARVAAGRVDTARVRAIFTTPPYHDYHWVVRPDVAARFGADFVARVSRAFLDLDASSPTGRGILELFGAERFVPTHDGNYREIEQIARDRGLLR